MYQARGEAFRLTWSNVSDRSTWPGWLMGNPAWVERMVSQHRADGLLTERGVWFVLSRTGRVVALVDTDFLALFESVKVSD